MKTPVVGKSDREDCVKGQAVINKKHMYICPILFKVSE